MQSADDCIWQNALTCWQHRNDMPSPGHPQDSLTSLVSANPLAPGLCIAFTLLEATTYPCEGFSVLDDVRIWLALQLGSFPIVPLHRFRGNGSVKADWCQLWIPPVHFCIKQCYFIPKAHGALLARSMVQNSDATLGTPTPGESLLQDLSAGGLQPQTALLPLSFKLSARGFGLLKLGSPFVKWDWYFLKSFWVSYMVQNTKLKLERTKMLMLIYPSFLGY